MSDAGFTTCPVLFEDRWLLVIHKPHGVLSHPNPRGPSSACAFEGRYDFESKCFAQRVWLIHRLDQDTSGVLLAAKDEDTANALRLAFENNEVKKLYLALTSGGGLQKNGVWQDHLAVKHTKQHVRTEVLHGMRPNAESHFRLLDYSSSHRLSLLEIALVTGKTHQIRVQAASRHHPVIGDDIYGNFKLNRDLRKTLGTKRLCLHAHTLAFRHPHTGEALSIQAPLPEDMQHALARAGIRISGQ